MGKVYLARFHSNVPISTSMLDSWWHTDLPNYRSQCDWSKGFWCGRNCQKNRFDRCHRKNKAGIQHNNCLQKNNLFSNSNFSPKVFIQSKENLRRAKTSAIHTQGQSWKGIQENTSLSNIYRRSTDQGATLKSFFFLPGYSPGI